MLTLGTVGPHYRTGASRTSKGAGGDGVADSKNLNVYLHILTNIVASSETSFTGSDFNVFQAPDQKWLALTYKVFDLYLTISETHIDLNTAFANSSPASCVNISSHIALNEVGECPNRSTI